MNIELSLNGKRVFLLAMGLVISAFLLFAAGMVVEAGRARHLAAGSQTGAVKPAGHAAAAAAASVPAAAVPSAPRLKPSSLPTRPHRLTPIPVLNHPPASVSRVF